MPKFDPKTAYDIVPDNINIKDFHEYAEEFVVRPPYQRKNVWSRKKQQDLLDSLFRRYYVPRIAAGRDDLKAKVNATKRLQNETQAELGTPLLVVLGRTFRGEL